MMTISAIKSAAQAGHYYAETDDYYREDGAAPSAWRGRLAAEMGLSGEVEQGDFSRLLDGHTPDGERLGRWGRDRHTGESVWQHRPAYDATFSAPKSVSVMALVGGDARIIAAHDAAVAEALADLEQRTCTRIREHADGGVRVEQTGQLAAATFRHETSRALDALLHTHCVIANAAQDSGGQWRSIESRAFYAAQRESGLVYQQALGRRLRPLGYDVVRVNHGGGGAHIEIANVPRELVEFHSSRRAAIRAGLAERGIDIDRASRNARQAATLDTRSAKQRGVDHAELRRAWREHAAWYDLDALGAAARERAGHEGYGADDRSAAGEAVTRAAAILAEREARFTRARLREIATREALGSGASVADIDAEIEHQRASGELVARRVNGRDPATGQRREMPGFTSRAAIRTERAMLAIEHDGRGRVAAMRDGRGAAATVARAEASSAHAWTPGQRAAAAGLLTSENRVSAIQGYAGTAKTTSVLRTVADEYRATGGAVRGLAPTAAAAAQLRDGAQIEDTNTVARLITQARAGQLGAEAGELWLVDEASLLSARDMRDLLRAAEQAEARCVLVGDVKQLGSVEAGDAFRQLQEAGVETHKLAEIVRQCSGALRQGVEAAIAGDARATLAQIEHSGVVREYASADDRRAAIVDQYLSLAADERAETLVIDPSREGRAALNTRIRDGLKAEGAVTGDEISAPLRARTDMTQAELQNAASYTAGDVVQFRRDYRRAGIEADRAYKVVGHESGTVLLQDERGERRAFTPARTAPRNVAVYHERDTPLASGDRVAFTENDKTHGVNNGDRATVARVDRGTGRVTVTLDRGGRTLDLDMGRGRDRNLRHDYVTTAHAAQGRTADRVLVHAESGRENLVNQQSLYVAISRARDRVELVTDDRAALIEAIEARTGQASRALFSDLEQTAERLAPARQWQRESVPGIEMPGIPPERPQPGRDHERGLGR